MYTRINLSVKQLVFVSSMLFGMFFGAGNLIFPVSMGQLAGAEMWKAAAGFLMTGVGLPILAVAALGISRKEGLLELSQMVGKGYGTVFTCILYLTIGPFFAIPRCATVSFETGVSGIFPGVNSGVMLPVFSVLFFGAALLFSLRPGEILVWIGKVLNPLFLLFLGILVVRALLSPMSAIGDAKPVQSYASNAFFRGFLEGYNTMDVLAGLAFGIVVVNVIRGLGVEKPEAVAKNTIWSGMLTAFIMAVVYVLVTVIGAQSRGLYGVSDNGGKALSLISGHYFGSTGAVILGVTITIACLKTSVGLITSCGETFVRLFPKGPSYRIWAVLFSVISLLIANLGLNVIIAYSTPVLRLLYPLAITLILLALTGRFFGNSRAVCRWVTGCTALAAVVDFLNALPRHTLDFLHLTDAAKAAEKVLPLGTLGFGWICPALAGLLIGLTVEYMRRKTEKK